MSEQPYQARCHVPMTKHGMSYSMSNVDVKEQPVQLDTDLLPLTLHGIVHWLWWQRFNLLKTMGNRRGFSTTRETRGLKGRIQGSKC